MSQAIRPPEGDAIEPGEPATEAKDRQDREARLGRRLRAARKAQRLSLRDLAGRLDVSASFLSQLENGKARPSVATLYTLCSVLGVSMDELFRDEELGGPRRLTTRTGTGGSLSEGPLPVEDIEPPPPSRADAGSVVRSHGRRRLELDSGVVWEQLATLAGSQIDFMLVTYAVDGSSTPDERLLRHSGVEYGFVTAGRLEVTLGFDTVVLEPGDSVAFDSTTPHRLTNAGEEPAVVVWVVRGRGGSAPHG